MSKKFYITTPIYYVNDAPHIGSAYTTLAADITARYYRQRLGRENVFFLTGTDEHGQKIQQAAEEKKTTPIKLANEVAEKFKDAWKLLNIDYDYFIRTTDPKHEKVVGELLQKVYDAGFIYSGTYEGPYCIGCERFYKESELVDGRCPLHPTKEISHQKERNYFLKLTELVEKEVLPRIEKGEYKILPEERKNEVVARIKQGVEDISVSREGVSWGVPVPWDKTQTIYVWVDALINYFSATKFVEGKEKFWPADLHLVGKDILWFHSVIWQALLIAAGEEIPKTIFAHGFFTIDGQKMSKSLGNIITPKQLVDKYGVDGARYLAISAVSFGSDGDISLKDFDTKFNADLANGLGNLVARIAKVCENIDINITAVSKTVAGVENKIVFWIPDPDLERKYIEAIESYRFDEAIRLIWEKISELDAKISNNKPWEYGNPDRDPKEIEDFLTENTADGAGAVLWIRDIAKLLKPFLPETAEKIEKQFKGPKIKSGDPLFPRL
jgi:methionyl-tRNA synthetase